jgi:hypothetical protein
MCPFIYSTCRIKGESVGLSVYSATVARQRLGKHVLAATENYWGIVFNPVRIELKENILPVLTVMIERLSGSRSRPTTSQKIW